MLNFLKKIWGSDSSRQFKFGAWVAAGGAFGAWYYIEKKYLDKPATNLDTGKRST